jgi:uncharacterized protein
LEEKILYFETPGKTNTDSTLNAVRRRAGELKVKQIVVASTHGHTAKRAAELLGGGDVDIIAVSISAGFDEEGWTMTRGEREELEKRGIRVITATHALGDDVSEAFSEAAPNKIVRETLYRFCQGMKVAVEVSLMAADAGLLDVTREAIAVGGTNEGADTAIVLKPACTRKFKDVEIREIIAKPR